MYVWGEIGDSASSGKLKYEKKLVGKPLNRNLGDIAMHKRDSNKSMMKHLLSN
jgi:hypothetical protein